MPRMGSDLGMRDSFFSVVALTAVVETCRSCGNFESDET
jgi:hypothetical protein